MIPFLEWILDLDHIRLAADRPLLLKWLMPLPPWLVFTLGMALVLALGLIYRREETSLRRRLFLAVPRLGLLALILILICQPLLVLQRNRVEPATVVVMLDRSKSMQRLDGEGSPASAASAAGRTGATPASRWDRIQAELRRSDFAPLAAILQRNRATLAAFGEGLEVLSTVENRGSADELGRPAALLAPDAQRSDLFQSLSTILDSHRSGPLAAVILASDGQSTETAGLEGTLERARALKVPIYPIRIGSPVPPLDLRIGSIVCDPQAFAGDRLLVRAEVLARGLSAPLQARLLVIEDPAARTLVSKELVLTPESPEVTVEAIIEVGGDPQARYRVRVEPNAEEQDPANNEAPLPVEVITEPLKVLYVEGYPRFEYRYIKNALIREKSVEVSCLLLSADQDFAQEGDAPIRRFPETADELNRFDVVIMGDVDPQGTWWTPRQADLLTEFVGHRGGGFILLAGERFAPHRFDDTPLQRLIPVRIDPRFQGRYASTIQTPYKPVLTAEGRESRLFRFFDDPEANARMVESLPGFYWIAQTLGPRPGCELLAQHDSMKTLAGAMPLIVQGRYGAGAVLFMGTDEFWLWRRHSGEALEDALWVQAVRMVAPAPPAGGDPRLQMTPSRKDYELGQNVEIHVRIRDPELLAAIGQEIELRMTDADDLPVERLTLPRLSTDDAEFSGLFHPTQPGQYTVQFVNLPSSNSTSTARVSFEVRGVDRESVRPEANHDLLMKLAEVSGGAMVDPSQLTEVFSAIPDRSVQTPDDITEPLWDSKLVLLLFVSMITLEWVGRKMAGLH